MHIFFKLLAVGCVGSTIGGITYLSRQKYSNEHLVNSLSPKSPVSSSEIKDVDVKRQPKTIFNSSPDSSTGNSSGSLTGNSVSNTGSGGKKIT